MGLFWFIGVLFSADARHNVALYRSGKADKDVVRYVTVGWRKDPIYEQDEQEELPTDRDAQEWYRI